MLNKFKYFFAKIVESHPLTWSVAWKLMHTMTFLLPHDKSYFALVHFCNKSTNELFLDIGANTGISALSFRRLNKTIPIYSIEPNIIHRKSLDRLKSRLAPFDFLLIGVGDCEAEIEFYTPIYQKVILHTFTSGSEAQVRQAVNKSFGPKIASRVVIEKFLTRIFTLDTLKLKPTIVKIDAEGFDYNVLLGAIETLQSQKPFVMFEACHDNLSDFESFFAKIGFKILTYHYDNDTFSDFKLEMLSRISGGRNVFAVPYEKLNLLPYLKE